MQIRRERQAQDIPFSIRPVDRECSGDIETGGEGHCLREAYAEGHQVEVFSTARRLATAKAGGRSMSDQTNKYAHPQVGRLIRFRERLNRCKREFLCTF